MNKARHSTRLLSILVLVALGLLSFSSYAQQVKSKRIVRTFITTGKDSLGKPIFHEISPDSLPAIDDAPFDTIKVRDNWSKLKKELSLREVEKLLGTPRSIERDMENAMIYFWYGHRAVVFNSITRKVSNWDK